MKDAAEAMGYRQQLRELYTNIEEREWTLIGAVRRRLLGEEDV